MNRLLIFSIVVLSTALIAVSGFGKGGMIYPSYGYGGGAGIGYGGGSGGGYGGIWSFLVFIIILIIIASIFDLGGGFGRGNKGGGGYDGGKSSKCKEDWC